MKHVNRFKGAWAVNRVYFPTMTRRAAAWDAVKFTWRFRHDDYSGRGGEPT